MPEHAYEEYEPDTPGAKTKSKAYKKSNRYSNFGWFVEIIKDKYFSNLFGLCVKINEK